MELVRVANPSRGTVLGWRVGVADRWWLRLRGLLGKPGLAEGEGLLLIPCRAIHMTGMRFVLDVGFLDAERRVVALYSGLGPGGRTRWHQTARQALELPAGTFAATRTEVGDMLETTPCTLGATG